VFVRARVVVDTNVFVSALIGPGGAAREVIRRCLREQCIPLMGTALFLEYEDLMHREELFERCLLSPHEREEVLDAFLAVCTWQHLYFAWRPNLPDEADNHLIELAVAGTADALITKNVRDLRRGELIFPQLRIVTPEEYVRGG
jgi:putative PIN family toxin of toxin-antitoxin system